MTRSTKALVACLFAVAAATGMAAPAMAGDRPDNTTFTAQDDFPDSSHPVAPHSLPNGATLR